MRATAAPATATVRYEMAPAAQAQVDLGQTRVQIAAPSRTRAALRDAPWLFPPPLADGVSPAAHPRGCLPVLVNPNIWSRKIMDWTVQASGRVGHAAAPLTDTCHAAACDLHRIVLNADNGGPIKGVTRLTPLQRLGVLPSFSRPGASNDSLLSSWIALPSAE
ncbi:MAG: hypothetical protein IPK33_10405 [Gemmatimonadetes bacterium]|nr:hypothetical protein [Gemmatimonadota bacterium]